MASQSLALPTDIAWERICVTRDMLKQEVCNDDYPPKWRTSIAVFKYVPDQAYQVYCGRKITYLKVSCTVAGYQPQDKEVQGQINWNGVNVTTIDHLDELLATYLPCNEAIIEVTVGPSAPRGVQPDDYPYFMDFQPKKRELIEMATDTGERMSRSMESLNISKSAGTSQSSEVLDMDQGFNIGASAQAQGYGGGLQYGQQGQWGTKRLAGNESSVARTTDESRERREVDSHTAQISQLYHLLDTYHLGTNRAIFYIQPRPHVLQEPSGFVTGPRPIEGIQEFFLIVNQSENQNDFCVSVRVDTGHLTTIPKMDYDRKTDQMDPVTATADVPAQSDPQAVADGTENITVKTGCVPQIVCAGIVKYNCFKKTVTNSQAYTPLQGYKIDLSNNGGFQDLTNTSTNGSSTVVVNVPNGDALTVTCEATGRACYKGSITDVVPVWPPGDPTAIPWVYGAAKGTTDQQPGNATRQILVNLISLQPIVQTGTERVLVVTTRGLCCCADRRQPPTFEKGGIVYAQHIGVNPQISDGTPKTAATNPTCPCATGQQSTQASQVVGTQGTMTIREANALSKHVHEHMIRSQVSRKRTEPRSILDTEFASEYLLNRMRQAALSQVVLQESCESYIRPDTARRVAKAFKKDIKNISRHDLLSLHTRDLIRLTGVRESASNRLRLSLLGVVLKEPTPAGRAKSKLEARKKRRR
jgi:hypothetical protein